MQAKLLQSCPTLYDPIDGSPPGSPIPGILQARTLEWVAIAFSVTSHAAAAAAKSLQSRPTLCDPIDGSPPGSPVPGILQARTLEQAAISFSNVYVYLCLYQCFIPFLWLNNIPLYGRNPFCLFCLSIHPPLNTWVIFTFCLLWTVRP